MNKLFEFDKKKLKDCKYIIGTDEAGRGPGAGPVFAAAVCFNNINPELIHKLAKLNDSKQLTEHIREELYNIITSECVFDIEAGSVEQIELNNILSTSLLTMHHACKKVISHLNTENIKVLVDGNRRIKNFSYAQETIIKGDSKSAAVAAASILAKVARDRFMTELSKEFPMYGWDKNKGYLTKSHLDAVDKYGLCKWHRKKFFQKHFDKSQQLKLL